MTVFGMDPATFWGTYALYATIGTVVFAIIMVGLIHLVFAIRRLISARRTRAQVRQILASHEDRMAATRAAWGHL